MITATVRWTLVLGIVLLLQACMALGPKFEPLTTPAASVSKIVAYRSANFINSAITPDLYVNGAKVASITNGGYVVLDLTPGAHRIHLSLPGWTGEATSFATTRGGDITYFRVATSYQSYPTGMRTFQIQKVSEVEASKEIVETRRVAILQAKP